MSAQRIARCGLSCALLAVSAWVSIPLGPVPFTLQTLVLAMLPGVLAPREAVLTVATYLVLGGVGLPVFSNMMGGIGVLLGPTGGFLWGFLIGMVAATAIARIERLPQTARRALAGRPAAYLVCPGHRPAHGRGVARTARGAYGRRVAVCGARRRQNGGRCYHRPRGGARFAAGARARSVAAANPCTRRLPYARRSWRAMCRSRARGLRSRRPQRRLSP